VKEGEGGRARRGGLEEGRGAGEGKDRGKVDLVGSPGGAGGGKKERPAGKWGSGG